MNTASDDAPAAEAKAPGQELKTTIGRLAARLAGAYIDPGEIAALRRLAGGEKNAAFWRVLTREVPEDLSSGEVREDAWAALLAAFALLAPLGSGRDEPVGRVLAETGYSEPRLLRLLRADQERVGNEIVAAARWLAAHGRSCNWLELARFALWWTSSDKGSDRRSARKIARDYFTTLSRKEAS